MSTNNKVEEVLAAKKAAATSIPTSPKPGEVGGELVGYAEAERHRNPPAAPAVEFSALDEAKEAFERASGKKLEELSEQDFYRLPVLIKGRNMQSMSELHVVFRDPSMWGHWFNWKAGNGRRVQQAYMMGFTACTKEDVTMCHAKQTDENGALVYGDLVLLKIPKAILWGGIYKENMEKAARLVDQATKKVPRNFANGMPTDIDGALPNGATFEGSNLSVARTADADYRNIDKQRDLVYAQ